MIVFEPWVRINHAFARQKKQTEKLISIQLELGAPFVAGHLGGHGLCQDVIEPGFAGSAVALQDAANAFCLEFAVLFQQRALPDGPGKQ